MAPLKSHIRLTLDNIIARLSSDKKYLNGGDRKAEHILLVSQTNNACLSLSSDDELEVGAEPDLHQCGHCKLMFDSLRKYFLHKLQKACWENHKNVDDEWNESSTTASPCMSDVKDDNEEDEKENADQPRYGDTKGVQKGQPKRKNRKGIVRRIKPAKENEGTNSEYKFYAKNTKHKIYVNDAFSSDQKTESCLVVKDSVKEENTIDSTNLKSLFPSEKSENKTRSSYSEDLPSSQLDQVPSKLPPVMSTSAVLEFKHLKQSFLHRKPYADYSHNSSIRNKIDFEKTDDTTNYYDSSENSFRKNNRTQYSPVDKGKMFSINTFSSGNRNHNKSFKVGGTLSEEDRSMPSEMTALKNRPSSLASYGFFKQEIADDDEEILNTESTDKFDRANSFHTISLSKPEDLKAKPTSPTIEEDSLHSNEDFDESYKDQAKIEAIELATSQAFSLADKSVELITETSQPGEPSWKHAKQVYRCPLCAKVFPFKSKLQRHVLVHTGIKPYKCTVCGRGFTQQIDLQRHLTRHTGEKPFKCHLCKAQFIRADNLRKHCKDAHYVSIDEPIRKRRRKTTGSDTVLPPLEVAIALALSETERNGGRVLGRMNTRPPVRAPNQTKPGANYQSSQGQDNFVQSPYSSLHKELVDNDIVCVSPSKGDSGSPFLEPRYKIEEESRLSSSPPYQRQRRNYSDEQSSQKKNKDETHFSNLDKMGKLNDSSTNQNGFSLKSPCDMKEDVSFVSQRRTYNEDRRSYDMINRERKQLTRAKGTETRQYEDFYQRRHSLLDERDMETHYDSSPNYRKQNKNFQDSLYPSEKNFLNISSSPRFFASDRVKRNPSPTYCNAQSDHTKSHQILFRDKPSVSYGDYFPPASCSPDSNVQEDRAKIKHFLENYNRKLAYSKASIADFRYSEDHRDFIPNKTNRHASENKNSIRGGESSTSYRSNFNLNEVENVFVEDQETPIVHPSEEGHT